MRGKFSFLGDIVAEVARIIGGAGTGKTTELLRIMDLVLERGICDPYSIGFVSFTRAARSEAASRAASAYGLKPSDLEQNGWFRTLHSICYRQLNIGKELLTGNAESKKWIEEAIEEPVSGAPGGEEDTDLSDSHGGKATLADHALALWDLSRSTLQPIDAIWDAFSRGNVGTPNIEHCKAVIERYEQMKRLDGRCDFTDLLGRFAGIRFGIETHERVIPEGEVPEMPAIILDEQQDTSALLDAVCRRLVEPARFAYMALDPFQSIYSFVGSNASLAMAWEIQEGKQRILQQSYRCPARVMTLGEQTLSLCSDYWDRKIAPRPEEGTVDHQCWNSYWDRELNPHESWLLLARTNFQARRIAARLNEQGIPWVPTRGNGGWKDCARLRAICALDAISQGFSILALQWRDVTKTLPSRVGETEFLTRGTKTQWAAKETDWEHIRDLGNIGEWGASPSLVEYLRNGRWKNLIKGATEFCAAAQRWGYVAALESKVRVGTIHSAKGAEADNVILLTTTSSRVEGIRETQAARDEEQRVAYVGVTRARQRLVILDERTNFRMGIPSGEVA